MLSSKLTLTFFFATFLAIQVAPVGDTARELGKATWSRMATIGAKNLEADAELKAELVRLGTESKVLTPLLLQRISVVECRADRKLKNSSDYVRIFTISDWKQNEIHANLKHVALRIGTFDFHFALFERFLDTIQL